MHKKRNQSSFEISRKVVYQESRRYNALSYIRPRLQVNTSLIKKFNWNNRNLVDRLSDEERNQIIIYRDFDLLHNTMGRNILCKCVRCNCSHCSKNKTSFKKSPCMTHKMSIYYCNGKDCKCYKHSIGTGIFSFTSR